MSTKKVSEMTELTSIAAADELMILDASETVTADKLKRVSVTNFQTSGTIQVPVALTMFMDKNQRNLDENFAGAFSVLATADTLANGDSITVVNGISKIILVINAGSDVVGNVTITGTSVNRDTGVETVGDTDVISLTAISTDNSDTDAQGNTRHAIVGAYITSKWFKGSITISTSEVTITDIDVYSCTFEQWNDNALVTLNTIDFTGYCTNASGWFYAYYYTLDVDTTAKTCTIARIASLELPVADVTANKYYRLRKGNLNTQIIGTSDGVWVDLFFGRDGQTDWQDINLKLWANLSGEVS